MTNEQLAEEIRLNGDKDLIPLLWNRVKAYMFTICGRYYARYAGSFARCGVELADIRQECYPAYLQGLESYKIGEGHKFISFLHFPLKNAMRELLGIRRNGKGVFNKRPLDNALSLDVPIPGGDDESANLIETVVDETAEQAFIDAMQAIEDEETKRALEQALNKLDKRQREIITLYYFEDTPLKGIAERQGLSVERISKLKKDALSRLRTDPNLRIYREEQRQERRLHFDSRNYSEAYMIAQGRIKDYLKTGRYLSYGREQAIINECKFKAALEDSPQLKAEWEAFTLLERITAKREEICRLAAV